MISLHNKEKNIRIIEKIKIENVHIHLFLPIHNLIKEKEDNLHLHQLIKSFNQKRKS
jgi:hypothetical protein